MPDDLTTIIETVAQGPAQVTGDMGSMTTQKIPDLITADQYLKSTTAAANPRRGLRFTILKPPGAV